MQGNRKEQNDKKKKKRRLISKDLEQAGEEEAGCL